MQLVSKLPTTSYSRRYQKNMDYQFVGHDTINNKLIIIVIFVLGYFLFRRRLVAVSVVKKGK